MNNNMVIIENNKEFIPVYRTEQGIEVIDGRELYNNLPIGKNTKFADWIKDNLNNIDAIENIDFFQYKTKNPKGGRPRIEYILKLDIAKEICMITGANPNANEELRRISKAYRKYFIELENKYKTEILNGNTKVNKELLKELRELRREVENLNSKINILSDNQNRNSNIETSKVNYKDENIIDDFNYSRFLNHINNLTDNTVLTKKEFLNLFNSYKFYHKEIGIMALNKFMNENNLIYGNDRLTDYARENNILTRDTYKNHNKVFFTKNGILYISNLLINNMHGDYKIKRK